MKTTSIEALTRYVLKNIYEDVSLRKNNEFYFSMSDIAEKTGFALSTFRRDPGKYESGIITSTDFGRYFDCENFGISLFDEAYIYNGTLKLKRSRILNNPRYSSLWGLDPDEEINPQKIIQKCDKRIKQASRMGIIDNDNCCIDLVGAYLDKEKFEKRFESNIISLLRDRNCRGYYNINGEKERFVIMVSFDYRVISAFLEGKIEGEKAQEDFKLLREMIQECMIDDGHFYSAADKKFNFW